TIQYLKAMAKKVQQGKAKLDVDDPEGVSEELEYITGFGDSAAEIVTSLRSSILPGMKQLLT
ncbi:hypothetical protein GWM83_02665, partial [Candidatus Bathyarchaeota archaeon]|nr:hypothetical protein [Desulfobacterales bacterium]NIW34448.1 hypothetical protein [Candidatus Bathyarchaeota archaeon]